jgi:hypothetical protein
MTDPRRSARTPNRAGHNENDMATIDRTTATQRVPMTSLRKTALFAGLSYVISFISIPTFTIYSA